MILMVTIMVFLGVVEPARASGTAAGPGSSFSSFSFRRGATPFHAPWYGVAMSWSEEVLVVDLDGVASLRVVVVVVVVVVFLFVVLFAALLNLFSSEASLSRRGRGRASFRALLLRVARGNGFRRVLRQCRRLYRRRTPVPFVSTTTNILALVVTQLAAIVTVAG